MNLESVRFAAFSDEFMKIAVSDKWIKDRVLSGGIEAGPEKLQKFMNKMQNRAGRLSQSTESGAVKQKAKSLTALNEGAELSRVFPEMKHKAPPAKRPEIEAKIMASHSGAGTKAYPGGYRSPGDVPEGVRLGWRG